MVIRKKYGLIWKALSFMRFLIARIFYSKAMSRSHKGLIGRNCTLVLNSQSEIGNRPLLMGNVEVIAKEKLKVGSNFCINDFSRVIAHNHIEIGDHVTIARFVSILDHDHDYEFNNGKLELGGYKSAPIVIGSNVWIADKVSILKGVTIGSNVIVGSNSVVTKDIPSNTIVGGVPARVIKSFKDDI